MADASCPHPARKSSYHSVTPEFRCLPVHQISDKNASSREHVLLSP